MPPKRTSTSINSNASKKIKREFIVNETNEQYQEDDADVTIISSDQIRFKVHSYVLKAASVKFREMLTSEIINQELVLSDPLLERSSTLSWFLDVCHSKELPAPKSNNKYIPYITLIQLATKYECKLVIQQISLLSHKWCEEQLFEPASVFMIGCALDAPDLTACAIRQCGGWRNSERKDNVDEEAKKKFKNRVGTIQRVAGASVLDPTAMDFPTFKALPDE
ncbi:uncharacterized protein L201_007284 [Kwoniella dendrophila CBS 6074]|uniref:BTB domain-containing protein n=1 Tax=Kwoniella dendrophila CBS 6074 TaxID=1295534 RepID=A0AAX4K6A8_9TREE